MDSSQPGGGTWSPRVKASTTSSTAMGSSTARSSSTRKSTTRRWRKSSAAPGSWSRTSRSFRRRTTSSSPTWARTRSFVTRDDKMKIHVLLNMCRHRGNRVTRADDGNAKRFMCTYHGWTFENDGRLTHIPGEQEAYYGAIDKESMALVEAKVDTYAGIIFATWDHDAPSLEAWLGDARWYMDTIFNRNDAGMIAFGPQKWIENCNWKTPVDNCSDNYHLT